MRYSTIFLVVIMMTCCLAGCDNTPPVKHKFNVHAILMHKTSVYSFTYFDDQSRLRTIGFYTPEVEIIGDLSPGMMMYAEVYLSNERWANSGVVHVVRDFKLSGAEWEERHMIMAGKVPIFISHTGQTTVVKQ